MALPPRRARRRVEVLEEQVAGRPAARAARRRRRAGSRRPARRSGPTSRQRRRDRVPAARRATRRWRPPPASDELRPGQRREADGRTAASSEPRPAAARAACASASRSRGATSVPSGAESVCGRTYEKLVGANATAVDERGRQEGAERAGLLARQHVRAGDDQRREREAERRPRAGPVAADQRRERRQRGRERAVVVGEVGVGQLAVGEPRARDDVVAGVCARSPQVPQVATSSTSANSAAAPPSATVGVERDRAGARATLARAWRRPTSLAASAARARAGRTRDAGEDARDEPVGDADDRLAVHDLRVDVRGRGEREAGHREHRRAAGSRRRRRCTGSTTRARCTIVAEDLVVAEVREGCAAACREVLALHARPRRPVEVRRSTDRRTSSRRAGDRRPARDRRRASSRRPSSDGSRRSVMFSV